MSKSNEADNILKYIGI